MPRLSEHIEHTPEELLRLMKEERLVVRVIIEVSDQSPHDDSIVNLILFTLRPWWSRIGKLEWALPGGRFEANDLSKFLADESEITRETLLAAAAEVGLREVLEEFGFMLPYLPEFVLEATNRKGYTSLVFYIYLEEGKPDLVMNTDSDCDGLEWVLVNQLIKRRIFQIGFRFFQDHRRIVAKVLQLKNLEN